MIYLDNAGICKSKPEVVETVIDVMKNSWANASAVNYDFGLKSAQIINKTREIIANTINCNQDEIIFTSCGSESNSLAVDGFLKSTLNHYTDCFITSPIEHSSILDNPKAKPIIFCDNEGFYKMEWVNEIHDSLVVLSYANSEIGVIQNIKEIIDILHSHNCVVHIDAVAAFGKIPINVKELNVDMLSATGQKIGGVPGAAFLYVKNGIKLKPIIYGTQNNGLRGGTYNVAAVCGLCKAIEIIDFNEEKALYKKRNYLLYKLLKIDGVELNGPTDLYKRLPNNINICVRGIDLDSQQLISLLDLMGYACAAGSACHSGMGVPSHVLKSIGMSDEDANHSIRITLSNENTFDELDRFYNDFKNIVEQYRLLL